MVSRDAASLLRRGIFAVNKMKDVTSAEVLNRLKTVIYNGVEADLRPSLLRMGHGGTLDRSAVGVLVCGVNFGCKDLPVLLSGTKNYVVVGQLGIATDTFNETGRVTDERPYAHIREEDLENVLKQFVGNIWQQAPLYSALKVNSRRMSDWTREGVVLQQKERLVRCYSLECTDFNLPFYTLHVRCGAGFYIRSLVHDIGKVLDCMFGFCGQCPSTSGLTSLLENLADEDRVAFSLWIPASAGTRCHLADMSEDVEEFRNRVTTFIPKIKMHYYVFQKQKSFIVSLRSHLLQEPKSAMVHMDFSENYSFTMDQDAVQGYRWTNDQCTIHPFYVTRCEGTTYLSKAYVIVSNHLTHDADAVACFTHKLVQQLRNKVSLDKLYYISDGCGGQYKNYRHSTNLLFHTSDHSRQDIHPGAEGADARAPMEIRAEQHFTATAHGKSQCDAIGAVTKRSARVAVMRREVTITNSIQMYDFCVKKLTSTALMYLHVSRDEVQEYIDKLQLHQRYNTTKTIPGTRSYHSYIPIGPGTIRMRKYSGSLEYRDHVMLRSSENDEPEDALPVYAAGQYVVINTGTKTINAGLVQSCNLPEEEYEVQFMKLGTRRNSFFWPELEIVFDVDATAVPCSVDAPSTQTGRIYTLTEDDWEIFTAFQEANS